ncbi:MerR family transcriptional regulator [Streptomyces telluris]|uniref:MerR family transcriptional regulator n=1 Tax=Streptomyces telluris TaxID=2720021 RepID=A0A9X2RM28_9ACTN|nr:MerR family transcriptional regulator [Streptomyces telluris]MCQ8768705.1 MerR family transcriptional regulator [Streptomyces telluris]NJP76604.1 MerR family transcriptional regulator [Streptomyces telluris]
MRLAELSEHSGVSTATIKYYLREGLLQPGRRISATQAEYGDEHLRRLRLVRALIQLGKMPVATAREVIAAAEDDSLGHHRRLGAATQALSQGREVPADDDPATEAAGRTVNALLEHLGWRHDQEVAEHSPAYRTLVASVAALRRLGYPCGVAQLLPYGRLAAELAVTDLDLVEEEPTPTAQIEAAVALTVLYEPVLLSLRRMAHSEESARRFTGGGKPA